LNILRSDKGIVLLSFKPKEMKMGAGLFWGVILIVIGLSLILRIFFDISVFRIVFACVLIFIGIKLLIGRRIFAPLSDENQVFFGERIYKSMPHNNSEYNTIFSKTTYDFREFDTLNEANSKINFNTVFGNTEVLLPKNLNVKIKADAVFASAKLPDGNTIAFGTGNYSTENFESAPSKLTIEANVVFGNLELKY
jgi:predicted membrane protein